MELRSMKNALNIVYHIDNIENKSLLELDQSQWVRDYSSKYAIWNWRMLKWIQKDIALRWDKNNKKIKKVAKAKWLMYDYNMVNGWVYWKTMNIPNIRWWILFTSTNAANSQVTFNNMLNAYKDLRDWHKWKFFNYKKSIDSKWKEVRSLVPAEIEWKQTIREWILNNKTWRSTNEWIDNAIVEEIKWVNEQVNQWLLTPQEWSDILEQKWLSQTAAEEREETIRMFQLQKAPINFKDWMSSVNEQTTCKL